MKLQDKIYMLEFIEGLVEKNNHKRFYEISSSNFHKQFVKYLKQVRSDSNYNSVSVNVQLSLLNIGGISTLKTSKCNIKLFNIKEVQKSLSEYELIVLGSKEKIKL